MLCAGMPQPQQNLGVRSLSGGYVFFFVDAFASIYTYNILDLLIFDNSKN